ncbi:zinc-finger of the MIZ type in Nse subunit-domain-containing protein [Lipomyces chichibuensis]|uniref:zinc-finger of the MIZ type in Nse subunit-domain-containing protein n=1 Tax=Lipomyces chichibuensis TaxID=1546026 RepID=UPI0033443017
MGAGYDSDKEMEGISSASQGQQVDDTPLFLREEEQQTIKNLPRFVSNGVSRIKDLMKYLEDTAASRAEFGMAADVLELNLKTLIDIEVLVNSEPQAIDRALLRNNQVEDPASVFLDAMEEFAERNSAKNDKQKYSGNTQYINFKRRAWENTYGDEDMPPIEDWFDAHGASKTITEIHERDTNDGDEDLIVAQEKRSLKCPVSLALLVNPVTSNVCPHTFSKDAIFSLFVENSRGRQRYLDSIECPVAGCDKILFKANLIENPTIARQVERYIEKQHQEDEADFDELEEE